MRRKRVLLTILVILLVLSLEVVDGGAQSTPKRGGMITVGMSPDVVGVDPHTTSAAITAVVMNHCFQRLVGYGENLDLVPVLAERWEVPADLKTYTFFLRQGKLFEEAHGLIYDGVPAIVVYNYNHHNAYWNYVKGFKLFCTNQPRSWNVWMDK